MRSPVVAVACLFAAASSPAFASGLFYGYGRVTMDYEWYHGAREEGLSVPVHEFAFIDSSGAFSAAIQTEANRQAAEGQAITEEANKIRKGESLGGRPITYTYEQAAAREGDAKRYGLRLGSKEGLNFSPITGQDPKKDLLAYGEVSLIAAVWGDILDVNDVFALRHDVITGARWGSVKHYGADGNDDIERHRDGGYFYIPVIYRLGFFLPGNVRYYAEAGIDPITAARIYTGNDALPHDKVFASSLEYRWEEIGFGFRIEKHAGSFTKSERKTVHNPVYQHTLIGAYVAAGLL